VNQYEVATRNLTNLTQERQCTEYAALSADVAQLKGTVGK